MKIICFGDSITRGISYLHGRFRIQKDNYPALLQQWITKIRPDIQVFNKGVFNDNSHLLILRLEKDVLSLKPDLVLIEIGGNDCNFRWEEVAQQPHKVHEPIVPLDQYLQNIKNMVQRIKKAGALPILLSLLPLEPARYYRYLAECYGETIAHWIAMCGGIEHWHSMYNRSLKQLIRRLSLFSIDIRSDFKQQGDLSQLLSDDGIHPSPLGYRAMAQSIWKGLKDLGFFAPSGAMKS